MDGPRLTIRIEPSRTLCSLLILLHAAAIAAPWAVDLPPWLRLLIALVAAGGLVSTWRHHLEARRLGPRRLVVQEGAWLLERAGAPVQVELLEDTTVWEWLVVLRLRNSDGCVESLPVLPDSCSAEELRRLRIVLRMGPHAGPVREAGAG